MNKQFAILVLVLSVSLVAVGAEQAYAISITGKVTLGGSSGVSDAKVTAEKASEYKWARANSLGNYDIVVSTTNSYTVESGKTGYTRGSTTVNGGSASPDHLVGTRDLLDIKFKVAYDTSTGVTLSQAKSWLLSAEGWFREEHSIDFVETTASAAWTSTDGGFSCTPGFLNSLKSDANWVSGSYGSAEILIGFTGFSMNDAHGCISTPIPSSSGTHPYIVVSSSSPDIARTTMHEISHAYGLQHTSVFTCGSQIPGIMASSCNDGVYIKNWTPSDDQTVESHRLWY